MAERLIALFLNTGTGWIAYCAISRFQQYPRSRILRVLVFGMMYASVNMMITAGDAANILGVLCLFSAGTALLIKGGWMAKLSMGAVFFSLAMSVSGISNGIVFLLLVFRSMEIMKRGLLISFLIRLLFWSVFYLAVKNKPKETRPKLPWKVWALTDSLVCMPVATILVYLLGEDFAVTTGQTVLMLLFSWISSMGALFLVCELDQNQRVMEERQLWKMRSLYYKNLEKEQLQIRRMKHDMQNHLYTLQGLPAEKKEAYLDDLLGALSVQRGEHFSDNPVVQTVLAKKASEMEEAEIVRKTDVKIPGKLPIEDLQLCALLANTLDNAIEACQKLPKEKRWIQVRCHCAKGMFLLLVENPVEGEVQRKEGKLVTTKPDRRNHGLGNGEISDICEKYHGTVSCETEKGIFSIKIVIPI